MPENTSKTVPCCATDTGLSRLWWEWHQDHWIIAAKPAAAELPDLRWVGSVTHSAQEGSL
jgi:hypothetical protein